MSDLSSQKANLRRDMLSLRKTLSLISFNVSLFLETPDLMAHQSYAGYWPMAGELDIRPLFLALEDSGRTCSLPVVVKKDAPLQFRSWKNGEPLIKGPHGTQHPEGGRVITPDVVMVPLLAFDQKGGRLGFGGGYYDRTLTTLSAVRVGMAFDEQEVETVPMDHFDQKMDWIVTPTRVIPCGSADKG